MICSGEGYTLLTINERELIELPNPRRVIVSNRNNFLLDRGILYPKYLIEEKYFFPKEPQDESVMPTSRPTQHETRHLDPYQAWKERMEAELMEQGAEKLRYG